MRRRSRLTKTWSVNRFRSAVRKGTSTLSRWILALALLPCVAAAVRGLFRMIPAIGGAGVESWWRYAAGAAAYLLLERFVHRPMWIYVVGHELTHAFTGLLSGARIHSFRAHANGGEVQLSKSNAWIALSPYIVPLYAVTVIALYAVVRHLWAHPWIGPAFEFVLGMALAFHVSLTVSALHRRQTDLKVVGFVLSGVLIVLGNSVIFGLLFVGLFSRTPTFPTYARCLGTDTASVWKNLAVLTKDEWTRTRTGNALLSDKEYAWTR